MDGECWMNVIAVRYLTAVNTHTSTSEREERIDSLSALVFSPSNRCNKKLKRSKACVMVFDEGGAGSLFFLYSLHTGYRVRLSPVVHSTEMNILLT